MCSEKQIGEKTFKGQICLSFPHTYTYIHKYILISMGFVKYISLIVSLPSMQTFVGFVNERGPMGSHCQRFLVHARVHCRFSFNFIQFICITLCVRLLVLLLLAVVL